MKILTPEQTKEVEKLAIEDFFLTQDLLMENAASALYREIERRYVNTKIVVLCGPGNNGGDGLALARLLTCGGWNVCVHLLTKTSYYGAALRNYKAAKKLNLITTESIKLDNNTLVVDALFGIGLNRHLEPETEALIEKINNSNAKILSVDIPTGINGLTGAIMGSFAVNADITLTFISSKIGHYTYPGADYCGELIVAPISIPQELLYNIQAPQLNTPIKLTKRSRNIHKGSYGKVLTIAGSSHYYGAPYFVSKSALLAGTGYSSLLTPINIAQSCSILAPEVIYRGDEDLYSSIKESSSVVFGPGLGCNDRGRDLLKKVSKLSPKNLIIDGDGLTLLSENFDCFIEYSNGLVLTPHPKEMSRLMNTSIEDIEKKRIYYALKLSKKLNSIVVLKGVYTVITTPEMDVYINSNSSNTLATAGSGDILCGIIAALTGYTNLINAVRAAVYIHGTAGIIAEKHIGQTGVTASDIMKNIPTAVNENYSIETGKLK